MRLKEYKALIKTELTHPILQIIKYFEECIRKSDRIVTLNSECIFECSISDKQYYRQKELISKMKNAEAQTLFLSNLRNLRKSKGSSDLYKLSRELLRQQLISVISLHWDLINEQMEFKERQLKKFLKSFIFPEYIYI